MPIWAGSFQTSFICLPSLIFFINSIEDTLTKTSAALYKLPQNQEDIGELVDYASEYLKNPSRTWVDADFIKKIQLQWFEFPQGITFNKGKFRTGQVASIFKVKDIFLPRSSSTVPQPRLGRSGINQCKGSLVIFQA